jgi:molybdopterin biosynthesis enzyme MoaB
MIEVGILCVGEQPEGLAAVRSLLTPDRYAVMVVETSAEDAPQLRKALRLWSDVQGLGLILSIGGVGVGLRERMADATLELVDRTIPGVIELSRLAALQKNRLGALSRAVCGVRHQTLIVNLPAEFTSPALEAILPILPRAVDEIRAVGVRTTAS